MIKEEQIRYLSYRLPYNLQFFANEGADKTEEPTAKKLTNAREEGQVALSKELTSAVGVTSLFIVLKLFVGFMGRQFIESFNKYYSNIDKVVNDGFSIFMAESLLSDAFLSIMFICLPVFIFGLLVTLVIIIFQVKWKVSGKLIQPKFSKLNPVNGFKRIISKEKLFDLVIEILKIIVISYVAYTTIKDEWNSLFALYDMKLEQAILLIGNIVINLGLKISLVFLIVGLGDFIYQKLKFKKDMRMTKQEVKDEYKNSEGDPLVKSKIKSKMREVSMRRMMQSLPQADVVITNPTHLAAAIQYDKTTAAAPVLLAKGADHLAEKIKDIAKENKIEIIENKPLARMLYYNVEVGDEVPPELYQMTAEVLAYVYGLKNKID